MFIYIKINANMFLITLHTNILREGGGRERERQGERESACKDTQY
jgi:hypothetical protein